MPGRRFPILIREYSGSGAFVAILDSADNQRTSPLVTNLLSHPDILPKPLPEWVQAHRAELAQVRVDVRPWHRPREKDVRLVSNEAGLTVTDEWIPDNTGTNIDPRPVRTERALSSFLTLVNAGPSRILNFVKRFGCLGLTVEGIPIGAIEVGMQGLEPVKCYRTYSRVAAATLRLHKAYQVRALGDSSVPIWDEDIKALRKCWRWYESACSKAEEAARVKGHPRPVLARRAPLFPFDFITPPRYVYRNVLETVGRTVNWWIETAEVRPYLHHGRKGWEQVYLTGDLWGAIGLQLMAAITRATEGLRCENCGALLRRKHWRRGIPLYCDDEACRQASWRKQKQRQRA